MRMNGDWRFDNDCRIKLNGLLSKDKDKASHKLLFAILFLFQF